MLTSAPKENVNCEFECKIVSVCPPATVCLSGCEGAGKRREINVQISVNWINKEGSKPIQEKASEVIKKRHLHSTNKHASAAPAGFQKFPSSGKHEGRRCGAHSVGEPSQTSMPWCTHVLVGRRGYKPGDTPLSFSLIPQGNHTLTPLPSLSFHRPP